jgi:hypothetical protein
MGRCDCRRVRRILSTQEIHLILSRQYALRPDSSLARSKLQGRSRDAVDIRDVRLSDLLGAKAV